MADAALSNGTLRRHIVRAAEIVAPRLLFRHRLRKYSAVEPEQGLVRYLCNPASVAIDVGANLGIYSGLMVRYAKGCHAFEANPRLARQLQRAAIPRLTVINAAVSDRSGSVTLYVPRLVHGLGTLELANLSIGAADVGPVDTLTVPAVRLDDQAFEPVSLIKIDVEGHEESVLRGADQTLARHRPCVIVESENRRNPGVLARLFRHFDSRSYRGYFLRDGRLKSLDDFDEARDQDPAKLARFGVAAYVYNFLFAPAEKAGEVESLPRV